MKVLFIYHQSAPCNEAYFILCLKHLELENLIDLKVIDLKDYLNFDDSSYDILIYHTFPSEFNPKHFKPKSLIRKTDNKFIKSEKYKMLFDSHASGSTDGFSRFKDKTIPRIKNAPHEDFLKEYDVICSTTYPTAVLPDKEVMKNVDVSFCVSTYSNPIREKILSILKEYKGTKSKVVGNKRIMSEREYWEHLRHVWVSVCAPGWGEGTFRHLETLNFKSLMLAHESINKIKLLPNADLIEGRDYISFNLENMVDKLDFLLENKDYVQKISEHGFKKFMEGYSIKKTATKFFKTLKKELC